MKIKVSDWALSDWRPSERIQIAMVLLSKIQQDTLPGHHHLPKQPTLALVRMVLGAEVQQLNAIRDSIEDFLTQ